MRIVVVGAGAMGSLVAGRLGLSGADVTLYGRPSPHLDVVRRRGLVLEELDGTWRIVPLAATSDPAAVGVAEVLVVLVKTWATADALAPLREHLPRTATVLTLQNGLGRAEAVRAALGDAARRRDVLLGVTTQGALRPEPGLTRHTGGGEIVVGREDGTTDRRLTSLAATFSAADLPTSAVADIGRWVWRKVAVNAAINPLTALAGVPNGAIVADAGLRAAARLLVGEVAAVARARGIELSDAVSFVEAVVTATAANRSSMLRDVDEGRQTEIDAINGAVVAEAERLGLDTPANRLVTALMRARQARTAMDEGRRDDDGAGPAPEPAADRAQAEPAGAARA